MDINIWHKAIHVKPWAIYMRHMTQLNLNVYKKSDTTLNMSTQWATCLTMINIHPMNNINVNLTQIRHKCLWNRVEMKSKLDWKVSSSHPCSMTLIVPSILHLIHQHCPWSQIHHPDPSTIILTKNHLNSSLCSCGKPHLNQEHTISRMSVCSWLIQLFMRKILQQIGRFTFAFGLRPIATANLHNLFTYFPAEILKFTKNGYFARQRKHLENSQRHMANFCTDTWWKVKISRFPYQILWKNVQKTCPYYLPNVQEPIVVAKILVELTWHLCAYIIYLI